MACLLSTSCSSAVIQSAVTPRGCHSEPEAKNFAPRVFPQHPTRCLLHRNDTSGEPRSSDRGRFNGHSPKWRRPAADGPREPCHGAVGIGFWLLASVTYSYG